MITQLDDDLFAHVQDVRFMGITMPARMSVVREGAQLVVISPFRPSDALCHALDALGEVAHIIAPNLFHHLFAGDFKARYPAKLWAPRGLEQKRPDLEIDAFFDDEGAIGPLTYRACPAFGMRTSLLARKSFGETVFFHEASRTLIVTDCCFHFDESCSPLLRTLARASGGYKRLAPSPVERFGVIDKAAARKTVDEILKWDFVRVVVAHGGVVEDDAKTRFRDGFTWLRA